MVVLVVASLLVQQPQDGVGWLHVTESDGLPGNEVRAVLADSRGTVWLSVRGHGLVALEDDGAMRSVTVADGLMSNGVTELAEIDGVVWAVGLGGFATLGPDGWRASTSVGNRNTRLIFSVTRGATGSVWLGASGFAARRDGAGWAFFGPADGLPHQVVHEAWTDRTGATWFACRRGLARLVDGEITVFHPDVNFRSIVEGADGRVWFGTGGGGVWSYARREWSHHLATRTVLPKLVTADGDIWASSEGDGAFRFDGHQWTHYTTEDGLPSNVVFDIASGRGGAIWFATDAGASRLVWRSP